MPASPSLHKICLSARDPGRLRFLHCSGLLHRRRRRLPLPRGRFRRIGLLRRFRLSGNRRRIEPAQPPGRGRSSQPADRLVEPLPGDPVADSGSEKEGSRMRSSTVKLLVYALIIEGLLLPSGLSAKVKHGASLVVTRVDGSLAAGELIAVKPDSLLLLSEGRDLSVARGEVRTVRIVRRSHGALFAGIGGAAGAVVGATAGAYIFNSISDDQPAALISGLAFGALGALAGLLANAVIEWGFPFLARRQAGGGRGPALGTAAKILQRRPLEVTRPARTGDRTREAPMHPMSARLVSGSVLAAILGMRRDRT
ncbi:MAG: hypothetical protein MZV70_70410 [Desulfobacterales bacterium]|nr:hypothetical protein [Desulfobacterales bacterium]